MNEITLHLSNHIFVVAARQAAREQMLAFAARLALRGPLRVLDGGNQFNVYPVARELRRWTAGVRFALENIRAARAFTCYQMEALLAQTPGEAGAVLVFDLLATFYDEDVRPLESRRLLQICLGHLKRISLCGPVVVGLRRPPQVCARRVDLYDLTLAAAQQVVEAD